jgi:hypothetical protein
MGRRRDTHTKVELGDFQTRTVLPWRFVRCCLREEFHRGRLLSRPAVQGTCCCRRSKRFPLPIRRWGLISTRPTLALFA